MKIFILIKQSFKAIYANKGRSFLTVLGIVIGIGSVIALMSLGNGVKVYISNQINALGTTTLRVSPGAELAQQSSSNSSGNNSGIGGRSGGGSGLGGGTSSLTVVDYNSLLDTSKNPDISSVIGSVSGTGIYSDQRFSITGATANIFSIGNQTVNNGRLFNDQDVTNRNKIIVLGSELATNLFGSDNPLGKNVTVDTDSYQVVGVLNQGNENSFSNPNLSSYIPYTSAMDSLQTQKFSGFSIRAKDENSVDKAKTEIQNTLLANHGIKDMKLADFSVVTAQDLLSTIGSITGILTALLSGIAAISLLVGGIGIMNIMLVSVTERTREIGLRKAVGAKTKDILVQFLIEAIFLTIAGGILGIGLGLLLGSIAGHFVGFSAVLTQSAVFLAVGISTAVGLVFGIYPAARAAKLNPIDALRYE